MGSFGKGWSFIGAAFAMAGQNKKLLAPSLYLVLVTILYYVGWVIALVAIDPHWGRGTWSLVGAISGFGSLLVFYYFCGMTVNMVDAHLSGGTPSLGAAAADATKNFVAIAYLALVSTLVELFAKVGRKDNSFLGNLFASILESFWTVFAFLLLPAIIVDDASFGQAMKRVRGLYKTKLLLVGVGEVGVRLVTGLIGFVAAAAIVGVVYLAVTVLHGALAWMVALLVGGTLLALFAAFNVFLRMAYYTCLYHWAIEVERSGAQVPAPGPLGVALGHVAMSQPRGVAI